MRYSAAAWLAVVVVCATGPLEAGDELDAVSESTTRRAPTLHGMTRDEFLAFHRELAGSAEFRALGRIKRDRIVAAQDTIEALLEDEAGIETLSERERIDLFNAHEQAVAILNGEERQRVTCKRRKAAGTHLATTECRSQADREALAQESRQKIRNPRHTPY